MSAPTPSLRSSGEAKTIREETSGADSSICDVSAANSDAVSNVINAFLLSTPLARRSAGILFCAGNVIGIPVTFLMQYMIDLGGDDACGNPASPVNIIIVVVGCTCSLVVLQYNGPYKRLMLEKAREEKVASNV